jgi:hypothetical protein
VAGPSTAFDHLPPAMAVLLPEMETGEWPAEQHADCQNCPMIDGRFGSWGFGQETRCCTAQPSTANFLLGRALRRGDPGRGKILARLADPDGVTPWGIDAPEALDLRYTNEAAASFGRDPTLRCPFYIGGQHTCGIWQDRSSTCRTWSCKYEDGLAGAVAWARLQGVMFEVESRLAMWAIGQGDPPPSPASPAAWAAWFERSATIVENITPEQVAALDNAALHRYRKDLSGFIDVRLVKRRRGMSDVLVPCISEMAREGGFVLLTGYSSFDAIRVPGTVFELLARLDGRRTWRQALDETRASLAASGEPVDWLDEHLIAALHRVDALRDPGGKDDLPYAVEMADMERWARAAPKP